MAPISAYGKKIQALLDLQKKGRVVTDTQILKLVDIKEIQLTGRQCLSHLRVYEKNDPDKLGIYLPDVNHHKLQLNEEKFKQMRSILKNRLERRFFERKLHVTALSVNKEGNGVPFYYQGRILLGPDMTVKQTKENQMHGEFILEGTEVDPCDVYCPLDGLHREFAMLDIVANDGEEDCNLMLDTPWSLSIYFPATQEKLNNDDSERYASMMRILSKIIAENANLSLNSTLCDAVSSVAALEEYKYLADFLLDTKDVEGASTQIVKLGPKEQKFQVFKHNPFVQTLSMFKTLCKSEDFLTLFKSKWKAKFPKNSDFKEEFWKSGDGNFSDNDNLKMFFIKNYDMGGHNFLKHITNITPNYACEEKKELGIEYACYCVARAIEPLFFCETIRENLTLAIDRLTTSGLITIHRLCFISTLGYEISKMIIDEFYRYSDFMAGNKDEKDYVLKSKDQKLKTGGRRKIAERILFNFIVSKIWTGYSIWKRIFDMDDKKLEKLEKKFRDLNNCLIHAETEDKKQKYNLGLNMVDLLHPDNPKFTKEEKADHLRIQVMDLFILRYADYLRTMLCSMPKKYQITLPLYQFCISHGKTLTEWELTFNTPFRIHWYDLITNVEDIWDVFRRVNASVLKFTSEEKKDVEKARFTRFLTYMSERYSLHIDNWMADWVNEFDQEDDTVNKHCIGWMYLDLCPSDFFLYTTNEPTTKIRGFDPLKLQQFFQTDHFQSIKDNPTETMKKYKIPLNEAGITNKKWAKYLAEITKIYKPEKESKKKADDVPDMPWDTLHSRIMNRYRRSADKDTFASGIVNFAITSLVKKTSRMKFKNGKWQPPKGHLTSKTLEVPGKEAESMLEFLKITHDVPPFIGNHFFCTQKAVSKNNIVQYQKVSPRKLDPGEILGSEADEDEIDNSNSETDEIEEDESQSDEEYQSDGDNGNDNENSGDDDDNVRETRSTRKRGKDNNKSSPRARKKGRK